MACLSTHAHALANNSSRGGAASVCQPQNSVRRRRYQFFRKNINNPLPGPDSCSCKVVVVVQCTCGPRSILVTSVIGLRIFIIHIFFFSSGNNYFIDCCYCRTEINNNAQLASSSTVVLQSRFHIVLLCSFHSLAVCFTSCTLHFTFVSNGQALLYYYFFLFCSNLNIFCAELWPLGGD